LIIHRQNLPTLEAKTGKVIHNIKVFSKMADMNPGIF